MYNTSISISLPMNLAKKLDEECTKHKMNRSKFIKRLLTGHLKECEKEGEEEEIKEIINEPLPTTIGNCMVCGNRLSEYRGVTYCKACSGGGM